MATRSRSSRAQQREETIQQEVNHRSQLVQHERQVENSQPRVERRVHFWDSINRPHESHVMPLYVGQGFRQA